MFYIYKNCTTFIKSHVFGERQCWYSLSQHYCSAQLGVSGSTAHSRVISDHLSSFPGRTSFFLMLKVSTTLCRNQLLTGWLTPLKTQAPWRPGPSCSYKDQSLSLSPTPSMKWEFAPLCVGWPTLHQCIQGLYSSYNSSLNFHWLLGAHTQCKEDILTKNGLCSNCHIYRAILLRHILFQLPSPERWRQRQNTGSW